MTQCVQVWSFAVGNRKQHLVERMEVSVNGQHMLNVSSVKSHRHAMGGNAMYDAYIHLAEDLPEWFCVENVPVFEHAVVPASQRLAVVSFAPMEWRDTAANVIPFNAETALQEIGKLRAFVLNLDKRPERWRKVNDVCVHAGLNCTRVRLSPLRTSRRIACDAPRVKPPNTLCCWLHTRPLV